MSESDAWRVCSICRKPIPFGCIYYACSVSTCTRKRTGLTFCSVECWEAHVPMQRHRDAWAVQECAPTEAQYRREQVNAPAPPAPARRMQPERTVHSESRPVSPTAPRRRALAADDASLPQDVLVVVSKLKAYVRARSDMNTSDNVVGVISDHIRELCGSAIRSAAEDDRRTVLDRDFVRAIERSRRS